MSVKTCVFCIPVLFHREDPKYDGEVIILLTRVMDVPRPGDTVTVTEGRTDFHLVVKGVVPTTSLKSNRHWILCEQTSLPYEEWSDLKSVSAGDGFTRL